MKIIVIGSRAYNELVGRIEKIEAAIASLPEKGRAWNKEYINDEWMDGEQVCRYLGTKNPVRGNSEGIFLFPCPHRVRNFMEKGSDFSLPERQNQIIFVILYKPIPNKRRTIQILM
ncbi:hypothetical protein [Alistipes shahii]|uniref:hypothetical protein n=1 Tax=Alistipes shahii TaxID=328814 RepID=UPI002097E7BE|nr:hypothetical protein [Alistipes shahii]MCO7107300.1 hypothetical protein [Alistipes shahii]